MKKQSEDWEDIKINNRSTDKVFFESRFIQKVSDGIDYLRDEGREILRQIEDNFMDDVDFEEFGELTIDKIDEIADDMSQLKSEIFSSKDMPGFVQDYSANAKMYLNRDEDYIRRAKRKLSRSSSDNDFLTRYKNNIRIIELCNKVIDINRDNEEAYYLKGMALINLEKYDEAIDEFIKSLSLKDDVKVWLAIANANRLNHDYDDALSIYNKILADNMDSFDAFKGKAIVYFELKDYSNADKFFKKAASIKKLDYDSSKMWDECLRHLNAL